MKKKMLWKILLLIGLCPWLAPLLLGIYTISVESGRTWADWLIMYSFVYWPTYIAGTVLIFCSACRLLKGKRSKNGKNDKA